MIATHAVPMTTAADLAQRQAWVGQCFTTAATLPLAFVLDEKKLTGIPATWQPVTQQRRMDANLLETVFVGTDPATSLQVRVECLTYQDYPVMEWVVLETMRRSVPLHYTDYGYGDHSVKLAFHHTLYPWIPYFKEVTLSWDLGGNARFDHVVERYAYHCGLGAFSGLGLDIRRDDYAYKLARDMIAIWRRAADPLLYGDYYPHTPVERSDQAWVAWQFDQPERGHGFLQAIRLPAAPQESFTFYLQGVDPTADYRFENVETGETHLLSGHDLHRDGFPVTLPARSGVIWFYQSTNR